MAGDSSNVTRKNSQHSCVSMARHSSDVLVMCMCMQTHTMQHAVGLQFA